MTNAQRHQRFAVAGGTGQIGLPISQSLAAAGFQVTVLSRTAKPSSDKNIVYTAADYSDESALVEVLKGHDVVIDALAFTAILADQDLPKRLARATKKAGVKLFVPNDWSFDMERVAERNDVALHPIAQSELGYHKYLQDELKLPYLGIWTGIFAAYVPMLLNIDFDAHTASFVGKGDTPFISTGYGDIGRFVAAAFTNLAPSQLENRTLRVVSQLKSPNEILKELAGKLGSGEFKQDNMSIEEAKEKASNVDFSNMFESMLPWLKLVAETGNGGGENNDNALVHFEPKESIVDTILADRRAASDKQ